MGRDPRFCRIAGVARRMLMQKPELLHGIGGSLNLDSAGATAVTCQLAKAVRRTSRRECSCCQGIPRFRTDKGERMPHRSRSRGSSLRRACTAAGTLGLGAALLSGIATSPASAIPIPPSTSSCTYNGSPVAVVASNTAGTPVTVSCTGLPKNTLVIVAQTSPLAGVISPSSSAIDEAALSTGVAVTTSLTGGLTATITMTATGGTPGFAAIDHKA